MITETLNNEKKSGIDFFDKISDLNEDSDLKHQNYIRKLNVILTGKQIRKKKQKKSHKPAIMI
jgi:hypothetical protein